MAKLGTRLLKLEVDSTERSAEVSNARITTGDADSDFLSFADAANGGARQYNLAFTAAQDLVADTLWDLIWTGAGSEVSGTFIPYGNAVASATQPHYEFTAIVSEPDGDLLGGEANTSTTARMTIDCVWPLTGKPTKVIS
ncbi:hypothetical protein [Kribbella sp. CA-293567]|uniref:hypothetical protein n=1 Tax=Kribbella sp. CA-293567 TaxID=3002436 RepID=UPI0022DE11A5|nr:hypothetical protein [Kribbella sp. CA-293567]WBQ02943.1 hypothetical protein OX958_23520 [Kribbella sp. CA-293567]